MKSAIMNISIMCGVGFFYPDFFMWFLAAIGLAAIFAFEIVPAVKGEKISVTRTSKP